MQELEDAAATLDRMKQAKDAFYRAATACGNHPFVEFAGLMNEFIVMCEAGLAAGRDFREWAPPMGDQNVTYLTEKLDCIFGGQFAASPTLRAQFFTEFVLRRNPRAEKMAP